MADEKEPQVIGYGDTEVHECAPGEYSWYVYAMQYLLKHKGYTPQADGYYAMDTAQWVRKFKQDNDLGKSMKCDESMWLAMIGEMELGMNDRGYGVRALQYLLRAHDYFIYTDEIFGSQCYVQLCKFQREHDLPDTGICDYLTWCELICNKL